MKHIPQWLLNIFYIFVVGILLYLILNGSTLGIIFIFVICIPMVSFQWIKKRRLANEEKEKFCQKQNVRNSKLAKINPKETLLYLRPFKTDANEVYSIEKNGQSVVKKTKLKKYMNSFDSIEYAGKTYTNIEALICGFLERNGFPIAIGDPNEQIIDTSVIGGASKIYATDATWQRIVNFYLSSSKLVILYVDFTNGTQWEIEQAIRYFSDKVLFIPKLYNKKTNAIKYLSVFDALTVIFLPFYLLFVKHSPFKRIKRGASYYHDWKLLFGFDINDKVCAVRFVNGAPLCYYSKDMLLETQLETIRNALKSMQQNK